MLEPVCDLTTLTDNIELKHAQSKQHVPPYVHVRIYYGATHKAARALRLNHTYASSGRHTDGSP